MRETVLRLYAALEARDWETAAALLAADVVYECPQTAERIEGRDAYMHFNRTYPGDWHLAVHQVVAEESAASAWVRATIDGEGADNVVFLGSNARGEIDSVVDFWPEPYEPPARA